MHSWCLARNGVFDAMDHGGITYSLRYQARALVAQQADHTNSKWLVGTNALREENEVLFL